MMATANSEFLRILRGEKKYAQHPPDHRIAEEEEEEEEDEKEEKEEGNCEERGV
jgi:CO dehydrogenase/acetyl-CoA synthase beta subunit